LLKSATLARLSGAGETVGFDRDGLREPMARWLYSRRVTVGEGRHVIDKNLALAAAAVDAARSAGPHVARSAVMDVARSVPQLRDSSNLTAADFPLRPVDSPALESLRAQGIDRYALVNPGAAWPNKRWSADRFGAVARLLADRHALTPIVLWGPNERALAQAVADASGGIAVVAPETQLPDLVALARGASFMISGDTGPLHIACAAGVPTVSLFGPTIAERNGPWNPRDLVITRYGDCACSYKRQCQVPERWCLGQITVEEVAEAVRARLLA
jgi:ADP-heptose:LPS heptosyltransferase